MNYLNKKLIEQREEQIKTLANLFDYATKAYPKNPLAAYATGNQSYTYSEFKEKTEELNKVLLENGIGSGDKVAILSQNMPNWIISMFSAVAFSRVVVPILPDSSENEVSNILTHSETKVVFVSKRHVEKITDRIKKQLSLIIEIDSFDILYKRPENQAIPAESLIASKPEDLAAIIYTSGTPGNAKGVMLCHRNLCHNIIAAHYEFTGKESDRWLSILPMSHTYEMSFSVLLPICLGASIYYLEKVPTPSILIAAMATVRPTIICSVPLIIEKIYKNSILPTIQKNKMLQFMPKYTPSLLYYLIGKKLKKTFGGKLRFFGIGGAKLDPVVETFLQRAHFPYAIGYGLTETAPLLCSATVGNTEVGSIGFPVYKVKLKLHNINPETGEGEIIAKGPNVMLGYYKDPERTAQVFTEDGWFRTNDTASINEQGRFYIKGRLNNMILGPSGENIYPEEIEQVLNNFNGVNESLVIQRNGKLVALVKFDDNVINWDWESENRFIALVEEKKKAILDYVNKRVNKTSSVNEVEIVKEPFQKTATQKIRRFLYNGDKNTKTQENKETKE